MSKDCWNIPSTTHRSQCFLPPGRFINAGEPIVSSRMIQLINAPATIYVKAVIAAKAGIQNWSGCRIGVRHDI